LVGIHGTGWWIGGRAVDLIGGHANWHPPGLSFTVHVEDPSHAITAGISDFEIEDEIYISAYDPTLHILASAEWHGRAHPMAWVKPYGAGRVFYTTLGHSANTFKQPAMQTLIQQGVRWAASLT
jgi:type 1 glutamine amidotransferase